MGAYLRCKLVDKNQALAVNDFIQTIKQNQVLMACGEYGLGVWFTCSKDIDAVKQRNDIDKSHKRAIITMLEMEIGRSDYKVSGIYQGDLNGMTEPDFFKLLASVYTQINAKFKIKYLCTSCALDMTFRFFSFDDMKLMTQNGRLLSGQSAYPDSYQEKMLTLQCKESLVFFPKDEVKNE